MTQKLTIVAALLIVAFSLSPILVQGTGQQSNTGAQNSVDPAEVTRLLQNGNLDDAARATITNYMKNFFARWTDPKNAADLGKYRKEIQTLIDNVSNPQGKSTLLGLKAKALFDIANDTNKKDFYPACRYNAVLALGELDEGVQGDGRPKPYTKALDALVLEYKTQGSGQDTAREAVRLGALQGIRRHVILGNVQTSDGQQIADLLMSIAADTPYKKDSSKDASSNTDERVIVITTNPNAQETSEPQRTVELHNWFRNNAIETLGFLSGASTQTQIAIIDTLLTRIVDEMELPSIRYQCAYSLSRFNKTIEASPDLLKKTTGALLVLGLVVHDDGIQTMLDEQSTQQTFGSMSGGMGGGGMGGGSMGGSMRGGGMAMGGMSDMSGSGSTMGQAQADQINNSLIQIKDGFSSMIACLRGPDYRSGGLVNSEVIKNSPYHEVLAGLDKTIAECVKFLDEGDPEAAKRAKAAQQSASSGMSGMGMSGNLSMGSGGGMTGTTTTTTVKNQPKVTMKEIEDQLKIVKSSVERLKGVMSALESGVLALR